MTVTIVIEIATVKYNPADRIPFTMGEGRFPPKSFSAMRREMVDGMPEQEKHNSTPIKDSAICRTPSFSAPRVLLKIILNTKLKSRVKTPITVMSATDLKTFLIRSPRNAIFYIFYFRKLPNMINRKNV